MGFTVIHDIFSAFYSCKSIGVIQYNNLKEVHLAYLPFNAREKILTNQVGVWHIVETPEYEDYKSFK